MPYDIARDAFVHIAISRACLILIAAGWRDSCFGVTRHDSGTQTLTFDSSLARQRDRRREDMMSRSTTLIRYAAVAACLAYPVLVGAHAPSGAIFTTNALGSEVNVNQYPSKDDVYLDGGPGIGAPQTAAALDDGTYYFQVTDPSGKTLLSTDSIECRRFRVTNGLINYEPGAGCTAPHATSTDQDHGGQTIQLMPFNDTPNPGGVYKAWVTFTEDYDPGCTGGHGCKFGFVPAHSKTDNFKVKQVPIREIDVVFLDSAGNLMPGFKATWIDPNGASNVKWSYWVTFWQITEAHIEAVEDGDHTIVIENQPGCTVGDVLLGYPGHTYLGTGPQTVVINVKSWNKAWNEFVSVNCQ